MIGGIKGKKHKVQGRWASLGESFALNFIYIFIWNIRKSDTKHSLSLDDLQAGGLTLIHVREQKV